MEHGQRQFGRSERGGPAPTAVPDVISMALPRRSLRDRLPRASLGQWAMLLVAGPIGLAWGEALFSSTALITPINHQMLWAMRGLGAIAGVLLWAAMVTHERYERNNILREILIALVAPVMVGFIFDSIAWRVADWYHFAGSKAAWEEVQYPIKSLHHGRKGARNTIEIDPFNTGESADIPVSSDQYYDLRSAPSTACVTVLQRRNAAGAIEIVTDGRYVLSTPKPVVISPGC